MRRHRHCTHAALITFALLCVSAAPAAASSTLLSGYGGPGQGNQAIIGSALVGGGHSGGSGRGGSGGAGGAGSAGGSGSSSSASGLSPSSIALAPATGAARTGSGAPSRRSASAGKPASPRKPTAKTGPAPAHPLAAPVASRSAGSGALGLSGADVGYIVLASGLLALTALLTVRLSRRPGGAGGPQ